MQQYSGDVPGASLLVVERGEVVTCESYGFEDLERRIAATPSTHYRLASISKQFTAAAVMLLAERSALSYGDALQRFFPSLPAATIRQLLTHTSGLVDYEDLIPPSAVAQVRDPDVPSMIEKRPPYFAPGSSYRYSNTGYVLLGLIIERVSGRSLSDFLRDELFLPLGMTTTVMHVEGMTAVPNRAFGYSRNGSGWIRTDQDLTSATRGDGGIYSSVEELARWAAALDAGRFAEAMRPMVATDQPGMGYGFGWRVEEDRISHTGETIGFRNAIVRVPAQGRTVVILTNRNEGEPVHLIDSIRFSNSGQ